MDNRLYVSNVVTFRIVDGYTGEVLQEKGEVYRPIDKDARIVISGDLNLVYSHIDLDFCECVNCYKGK